MRMSWTATLVTFALGACTATAVQTAASSPETHSASGTELPPPGRRALVSRRGARVTPSDLLPTVVAPSGKARVTHLALGENAYLGRLEMDGGGAVPEHQDATEEYIVVVSGGGKISIDGHTHDIAAGSAIYMPAGATVSYENGPEPLVAIQVFAGPQPADKYENWSPVEP